MTVASDAGLQTAVPPQSHQSVLGIGQALQPGNAPVSMVKVVQQSVLQIPVKLQNVPVSGPQPDAAPLNQASLYASAQPSSVPYRSAPPPRPPKAGPRAGQVLYQGPNGAWVVEEVIDFSPTDEAGAHGAGDSGISDLCGGKGQPGQALCLSNFTLFGNCAQRACYGDSETAEAEEKQNRITM